MTLESILTSLDDMLKIPSVIGHEGVFADYLTQLFTDIGYTEVRIHNFLALSKEKKPKKIVTAHLDRHGISVNKNKDFEYAAYRKKKENIIIKPSLKSLDRIGLNFLGTDVFAYAPDGTILGEGTVSGYSADYGLSELLFQVKGIENLPVGSAIAYKSKLSIKQNLISSQLDNAISIATLYEIAKEGFNGTILFSPEEEIGNSYLYIMYYLAKSDVKNPNIITLDTSPFIEKSIIEKGMVILRHRDEQGIFRKSLTRKAEKSCNELGIKYLFKDEKIDKYNKRHKIQKSYGTTELGRLVRKSFGIYNGATIQIPTLNNHRADETTSLKALENYYKVIRKMLK